MIALIMATAILTSPDIGEEKAGLRFIPPIRDVIYDESRKGCVKKSVRVGMTYGMAFRSVRNSLLRPGRDTLFTTKDQPTSFEFVENCLEHLETFQETRSKLAAETEEWQIPVFDDEGNDTGGVERTTVSKIVFDNGSRILSFSSNPNALRAYGGDVLIDEYAFHPRGKQMWAAAQGRARWGYSIWIWSSLAMEDTTFDVLADEAKRGEKKWSYHEIDLYRAVESGLVELINEVQGTEFTREEFIQDCKDDCLTPDIFALEYECRKTNTLSPIVSWEKLKACETDIAIERCHLPDARVAELFGTAKQSAMDEGRRRRRVEHFLHAQFPHLFERRGTSGKRFRIGFDVAASRKGHLASVWVDELRDGKARHRALLTFQTEDWDVMQWSLEILLAQLPGEVKGAGDETGLGRQICWNLEKLFYGRFTSVNFSREKVDMGTALMQELNAGAVELSRDHPDVTQDLYCIRKGIKGDRLYFFESKNDLLPESHADIAWSKALANWADQSANLEYGAFLT